MASETLGHTFGTTFLRSIIAGWIIALMIWLLPYAETAHIWVIIFLAYLIGIGHLPHIIAGTVPSFYAVFSGMSSFGEWSTQFFIPVVLGNIIGGVAIVAVVAHAEFADERE